MDSREISETRISELMSILPRFSSESGVSINQAADIIVKTFLAGSKVLICGNGGSATDSQHFAAEFVSDFSRDITRRGLPAISRS